ncbi:MAG: DJ-1/PfpI family protein [Actinomycetota bacterium]
MSTTIGIFIFDGAEELDWAGPYEVLASWAQLWPQDETKVVTLSATGELVHCAKGLRVTPDHGWDTAPPLDVLVYPGGMGTRSHIEDELILSWVRKMSGDNVLMTSVCTGSLVYAAAGLLDGRPATTHWTTLDLLASLGKEIELRPDDRFVDDGDIITSAGVSAGIDMALHLVARLHSVERAREVRRVIQYDPAPPV